MGGGGREFEEQHELNFQACTFYTVLVINENNSLDKTRHGHLVSFAAKAVARLSGDPSRPVTVSDRETEEP